MKGKAATVREKLILIAMQSPAEYVLQIVYIDSKGTVTDRAVSPYRYDRRGNLQVFCLGAEHLRTLRLSRILRLRIRLAVDVLSPEAIVRLVDHRGARRLRPDANPR